MGVKNYLVEGVSGAGKTTVAEDLQRRGYHVIHGDRELAYQGDPVTGAPLAEPADASGGHEYIAWKHRHWIWNADKVRSLTADHQHTRTFFCGGCRNVRGFVDLFDAVFVLDVDIETLKQRLAARPEDEFGGKPAERTLIRHLHVTQEDIPDRAISIDATRPIEHVVRDILEHCREREGTTP